jgi:hypothetical protein
MKSQAPHQTVGWLIEQLKEYPKNHLVFFHTSDRKNLVWLSDYQSPDKKYLNIDIGTTDE